MNEEQIKRSAEHAKKHHELTWTGQGIIAANELLEQKDAEIERLRRELILAGADEINLCPNCITPWKCNGPHLPHGENQ